MASFRHADELTIAIEARGFGAMNERTGHHAGTLGGMRRRRQRLPLIGTVVLALVLALLTGCLSTEERHAQPHDASPDLPVSSSEQREIIATGLDVPWSIAFFGDTALVSERDSGRILELSEAGDTRVVATISGVTARGEGGLLGIAVHDTYLYAYFTTADDNRVDRFALRGAPGALSLGSAETVVNGIPAASNHNGGRIGVGPDGMLYVTTGDAGDPSHAQDISSFAGKILRLTLDGRVPADNPFADSPVFSLGHRNPQGIAWAPDGTMVASEFGQNTWDELNVIEAGGNYGWPEAEGISGDDRYIDPVQQWRPSEASPSGIAVIGDAIYIANLRGERLCTVALGEALRTESGGSAGGETRELLTGEYGRLRDAVMAPDGSLWVLTNNTDGRGRPTPDDDRLLRIEP